MQKIDGHIKAKLLKQVATQPVMTVLQIQTHNGEFDKREDRSREPDSR